MFNILSTLSVGTQSSNPVIDVGAVATFTGTARGLDDSCAAIQTTVGRLIIRPNVVDVSRLHQINVRDVQLNVIHACVNIIETSFVSAPYPIEVLEEFTVGTNVNAGDLDTVLYAQLTNDDMQAAVSVVDGELRVFLIQSPFREDELRSDVLIVSGNLRTLLLNTEHSDDMMSQVNVVNGALLTVLVSIGYTEEAMNVGVGVTGGTLI